MVKGVVAYGGSRQSASIRAPAAGWHTVFTKKKQTYSYMDRSLIAFG